MDSNNWQPSQVDPPPMEVMEVAGADRLTTLEADSRSRIVNKILQEQQQMGLQQQSNSVQNVIDPEMMFQSQQTPPEAAPSIMEEKATAQTGSTEAQEEVYQKIKVMKELYFTEVEDVYERICLKLQQQHKSEVVEKLKYFKKMLERILNCLQLSRIDALQVTKERVARLEKQIISVVCSHRPRKRGPPLQQNQQSSHSQIPQTQSHESGGQLQPGSNLESGQGNEPNSIQQIPVSVPPNLSQADRGRAWVLNHGSYLMCKY